MGLWTSVVNGVNWVGTSLKTISTGISASTQWLWNHQLSKKAKIYASHACKQVWDQFTAIGSAVPTLVSNPEAKKIVEGMAYIAFRDVFPLIFINAVSEGTLAYIRKEKPEEMPWLPVYYLLLSGFSLIDLGIKAYTLRQGSQTFVRVLVLDTLGPAAFNSNKQIVPPNLCTELKCNEKRKIKGWGREPIILLANDALIGAISYFPLIGNYLSWILKVQFNGRYITRQVTPERCERHKAMLPESVLVLGLGYEMTCFLMNLLFEYTIGMPPFLCHRTLRHLLLLLHINLAAHLTIPLVEPKQEDSAAKKEDSAATTSTEEKKVDEEKSKHWIIPANEAFPIDVAANYERTCRFIVDVIFAGLIKRIPIDFKRPKNAPPLIPLSRLLRLITRLLKSDLEREEGAAPPANTATTMVKHQAAKPALLQQFERLLNDSVAALKPWIVPSMFLNPDYLINDPIINKHWPALREGGINAMSIVNSYEKNTVVTTLAWAPKSVASVLYYKFGISKGVTRTILMLSQEKDFWDLTKALQAWLDRHNVNFKVTLSGKQQFVLHGDRALEPVADEDADPGPPVAAEDLIPNRLTDSPVLPKQLVPLRGGASNEEFPLQMSPENLKSQRQIEPSISPQQLLTGRHSLPTLDSVQFFSTRKRLGKPGSNKVATIEPVAEEKEAKLLI